MELIDYIVMRCNSYSFEMVGDALKRGYGYSPPDVNGSSLIDQSVFIVGGVETPVIPSWNLGVFKNFENDSIPRHYGSAVLLKTDGLNGTYALTASHVLEDKENADKTKFHSVLWGSTELDDSWRKGTHRVKAIPANFQGRLCDESPVDLAVLEVDIPGANPDVDGLRILSQDEFDDCIENHRVGMVFGWGVMDRTQLALAHKALRDAPMEFRMRSHEKHLFVCESYDDRGPAKNDSGGPLVVLIGGELALAGIVKGSRLKCPGHGHSTANPTNFVCVPDMANEILESIKRHEATPPSERPAKTTKSR